MTRQRKIVRSRRPTECVWVYMVQLEKRRLPTALAPVIDVRARRARFSWLCISLRFALALALFGWLTLSLRLALAPARIGRRGSRPLHLSAAVLLQLREQTGAWPEDIGVTLAAVAATRGRALDTRGHRNQELDPVSDLRPYDAKSDS